MPDSEAIARQYIEALGGDKWEDAYHHLIEMGDEMIHVVGDAFRHQSNGVLRRLLTRILWQTRSDRAVPLLSEALEDSQPQVWKEALDGLVAIGSEDALVCLLTARQRTEMDKASWLDEGILQIRERQSPPRSSK
jgi:HEAT repeat protein